MDTDNNIVVARGGGGEGPGWRWVKGTKMWDICNNVSNLKKIVKSSKLCLMVHGK